MSITIGTWVQYLGMTLAMVGGAPWPKPNWALVAAGLAVLFVGIVVKRRAEAQAGVVREGDEAKSVGTVASARAAMGPMLEGVKALLLEAETLPLGEVAARIEKLQQSGTETIAAAQEALTRAYGFAGYASMMAPLAGGERWLYRAWSAASDGHRPEVKASLESAVPALEEAAEALGKLGK